MRTLNWVLVGQASPTMRRRTALDGKNGTRCNDTASERRSSQSGGTITTARAMTVAQAAPTTPQRGSPSAAAMGGPQEKMAGAGPGP